MKQLKLFEKSTPKTFGENYIKIIKMNWEHLHKIYKAQQKGKKYNG